MDPEAQLLELNYLRARCQAVERATRIIWACAAATDHIQPKLWSRPPDFHAVLEYFGSMSDTDLMKETKGHQIEWEKNILSPRHMGEAHDTDVIAPA
jgi:hypothetical protein